MPAAQHRRPGMQQPRQCVAAQPAPRRRSGGEGEALGDDLRQHAQQGQGGEAEHAGSKIRRRRR